MARRATRVCLRTKQLKSISTAVKFASRIVNFELFSNLRIRLFDAGSRGLSLPRFGKPTIKPSRSRCRLQQRRSARARTDSACVHPIPKPSVAYRRGGLARLSPFPFVLCILVHNGGSDAQVDRCCFCFGRRNFRPGHVARAASSTERHDHASPPTSTVLRPRSGTKMGLSTMRCKWHLHVGGTSPGPQTGLPRVCRME